MCRLALVVLSAGAFASSAVAADQPIVKAKPVVKAPSVSVAPAAASGISVYAGVHVGYGWSTFSATPAIESLSPTGWLGGFQLGANMQHGNIVFGLEGDLSLADIHGRATGALGGVAASSTVRHNLLATFGGRVGYSLGRTLPYIKAGGAWTEYKWSFVSAGATLTETHDRFGWMLGAGIEQAVTDSLSAKLEFNYLDFGRRTETFTPGALVVPATPVGIYVRTVKLGLNYRFVNGR